jgi:hypothetical protein
MSRWVVLFAAAFLASCAGGEHRTTADDVLHAQEEAGMRLYWLGESYAGLPLTATDADLRRRAVLVYGECDGESEGIDGFHCTKPQLQVQFLPFNAAAWKLAVGCSMLAPLRGVPTVRHDGLVLVTRGGLVKIYGRGAAEDRRVALALRPLGDERAMPLPPPSRAQLRAVAAACS